MTTLVILALDWAEAARREFRHRSRCQVRLCGQCFNFREHAGLAAERVRRARQSVAVEPRYEGWSL